MHKETYSPPMPRVEAALLRAAATHDSAAAVHDRAADVFDAEQAARDSARRERKEEAD